MSDDRLFDRFHVLDGPIEPEGAFAERLFEALAADLGFRPVTRREAVARRFANPSPVFRLAYLGVILALLLAATVAALVAAQLFLSKTAEEIVSASQAVQLDPPAYDMMIRGDDGRITRVRVDGHGGWRWDRISDPEMPEMPAGTYEVHAGGQVGSYDPGYNSWSLSADDAPIPNASLLGWQLSFEPSRTGSRPAEWFSCPSWERLADDVVADRPAYHVACEAREFWVDVESSLLVRVLTPAGQELASLSGRATALTLAPTFASDTFGLTGPADAVAIDPNNPPDSTVLAIGRSAPRLTGLTLDGKTFDTSAQAGPLVVYFWATWCPPCIGSPLTDLQTVATRHADSIMTVTIATDDELDALSGYVSANAVRLPVVIDSGPLLKSWGLSGIPVLVMLDRSGAVAALRLGPVPASELERMYAALAAEEAVPTPSR